ncbi:MAG TPA: HIT domain-containing protein [Spirochaetales bacterium]|nr:HIT domain-containing protein [Spirochaetales bacterium]
MEYFFNFDKMSYLTGHRPSCCVLCMVRDGSDQVQRLVVAQTESWIVSLNLYPYNPGHILVFPKRHVMDLRHLSKDERAEGDALTMVCLDTLDSTHHPAGYNLGWNMGGVAGASIEHLHQHIIPRYPREIGIAELMAGRRLLVEDPAKTLEILREAIQPRLADLVR